MTYMLSAPLRAGIRRDVSRIFPLVQHLLDDADKMAGELYKYRQARRAVELVLHGKRDIEWLDNWWESHWGREG